MNIMSTFICFLVYVVIILCVSLSFRSEATLMLSPIGLTSVCPERELTFLCSTNRTYIRWNVTILQENINRSRLLSLSSRNNIIAPLTVGTKSFVITVNSTNPFTSSLIIANTTNDLNGTTVSCMDIGNSASDTSMAMASVHIVKATAYLDSNVNFINEPGDNDVDVILTGTAMFGLSYSIIVHPPAHSIVRLPESTSFELRVAYNTAYNVSVVPAFCGENEPAMFFNLYFVKCDDLQMLSGSVNVTGLSLPAVPGSNTTFSCPLGLELIGPNSSICMQNGEWEPDPREVSCRVNCGPPPPTNGSIVHHTGTLDGAMAVISCLDYGIDENVTIACTHDGMWEPDSTELCHHGTSPVVVSEKATDNIILLISVISSTAGGVFLTSLLIFITGLSVCCWCKRKQKQVTPDEPTNMPVIYEEILPRAQEEKLELNQNMAYGQIRPHVL